MQSQNPTTPLPVRPQIVAKFKVLKFFLHFSSVWSQSTPEQAVKNEARWQHSRSMQKKFECLLLNALLHGLRPREVHGMHEVHDGGRGGVHALKGGGVMGGQSSSEKH